MTKVLPRKKWKKKPDLRRSQASKRSWKVTRQRRMKAIDREAKSPGARKRHRFLARLNKRRNRSEALLELIEEITNEEG